MSHEDITPYFRANDAVSLGRPIAEAHLAQQDLARKLSVGRGMIVRLEQGEPVSLAVAMAIHSVGREVALVPRFARVEIKGS